MPIWPNIWKLVPSVTSSAKTKDERNYSGVFFFNKKKILLLI